MKYAKDTLLTIAVLLAAFTAVMWVHFEETAETKFWWNFWPIAGIVCTVGCVGGWFYLWNKDRKQAKKDR